MARTRCRIEIDIMNNAELRANAQRVLTLTRAARPKNTARAYDPKQREFKVSEQANKRALRIKRERAS
jgi:hypothetical protein